MRWDQPRAHLTVAALQWVLLVGSSLALLWWVPRARTAGAFFEGRRADRAPGFWLLLASLVISWLFAKSLTNAANLGAAYGIVGGVAYATYYLSFAVAGYVIVRLRREGGFASIHDFLLSKHGRSAVALFSVLIAFRLFNEVWSNTMVIGSYFGAAGSGSYLAAVVAFTALTLAYAAKGGMSSSLLSDAVQMVLFGALLAVFLGLIARLWVSGEVRMEAAGTGFGQSQLTAWTLAGGLDLLLVALVQSLSYPFHDPVMTDRGFLADARTTRRAFYWAVPVGAACIVAFSLVGVFARAAGLEGEAPVAVARLLGVPAMLVVNLIMVTSAASTLDSAFSSWAGLATRFGGSRRVSSGRLAMAVLAVAGTVPVWFGPEVLSATTISGLMVVGLAPGFLGWRWRVPWWAFHVSVAAGLFVGIHYAAVGVPAWLMFGGGKYAGLLGATVFGTIVSSVMFGASRLISPPT